MDVESVLGNEMMLEDLSGAIPINHIHFYPQKASTLPFYR